MRSLKYIFIIIFVLSVNFVFSEEPMSITLDQQKFAKSIVSSNPNIITASWLSETDLWVESMTGNKEAADNLALEIINEGRMLNQSFCVIIHPGNYKEIAKHCLQE